MYISSSSSCSLRVRCIHCSLILKVELVPPSLLRSSNVPSSFWSVFQCLSLQSISVHPLYVLQPLFLVLFYLMYIMRKCVAKALDNLKMDLKFISTFFWCSWYGQFLHTIFYITICLLISVLLFNFIYIVACWLRNVDYDYVRKTLQAWRISVTYMTNRGPWVAQWLRHCATNWKVPQSIPGVAGDFFRGI